MTLSFDITTAPAPGAIGIVQLHGPETLPFLAKLTGTPLAVGRCRLVELPDIDEALIAILRDDWAQIMPHGGPRVMQRLAQRLLELGASPCNAPPASLLYPEAESALEADMLHTLANAASPAAIDLLLAQPRLWKHALTTDARQTIPAIDARNHLLAAPSVVLVGQANVGKSTLSNLILGRAASITADLPGTTRDWVAALAELPTPLGPLAVRWHDTPGLRESSDPIEQRAIALAKRIIHAADLLIAMNCPGTDWPALPPGRSPDVWITNKIDHPPADVRCDGTREAPLQISAKLDRNIESIGQAIARALGLTAVDPTTPWAFSEPLKKLLTTRDLVALQRYCGKAHPQEPRTK